VTEASELVERAIAREPRAVAKLISVVEGGGPVLREVMAALTPRCGGARVIGLTGAPGVGKSTTTSALVAAHRARGCRVGVLAVDPSSPYTGGALLGDRVRMQEHSGDPDVYIRSMASRGHLGGIAAATPQAVRVLDAAGFDLVVIETVGVGQAEVEIAGIADTTLVLLAPGMGDAIQAAKAGILEVADIFVVNKADRDGADATLRELKQMLTYGEHGPNSWKPPVLPTVASAGEGIEAVADAVSAHHEWLVSSGQLGERHAHRASSEIEAIALATVRAKFGEVAGSATLPALARRVAAGQIDAYTAADELVAGLTQD
jgi:LAO/AO transport system kinase